jgi:integrase
MAKHVKDKLNPKTLQRDINRLRALNESQTFGDGGGLYLVVTPAGNARFQHRFRWMGRAAERWLPGEFPDTIGLAEARAMRDADKRLLRDNVNPIQAAKLRITAANGVPTFADYAKAHVAFLAPPRPSCRAVWLRQMTGDDTDGLTVGKLAGMPIDSIGLDDVKAIIAPLWFSNPATAKTLAGRIRRIIDHRMVNAGQDDRANPANFKRLERAIGRKFESRAKPRAALPWEQIPAFLAKLADRPQMSARALEMVIATGCRAQEITHARWSEVDWKARTLTIPPTRMKTQHDEDGEAHVVPLSLHMVMILRRAVPPVGYRPDDLIFPNGRRNPYDPKELLDHVKALAGDKPTTHGFRSALCDWGTDGTHRARPEFDRDLMNVCIAHEIGDEVSQVYLRTRWLGRRRIVMREWSRFCLTPPSAVVLAFRKAA